MPGLSFAELWRYSRAFRSLFVDNELIRGERRGTAHGRGLVDAGTAELLWSERHPKIDWELCGVNGCGVLAVEGELCTVHMLEIEGQYPKWKWANRKRRLYKYIQVQKFTGKGKPRRKENMYSRNDHVVWTRKHGPIPTGYHIRMVDGNPFNQRLKNLMILSRYVAPVFDTGIIDAMAALDMDDALPESLLAGLKGGIQRARWVYGTESIAKAADVTMARVRQDISRGVFDPKDLTSVVEFCKMRRDGCRISKRA